VVAQQLDRDLAIEIRIVRGPHHTHAAFAEHAAQREPTELRAHSDPLHSARPLGVRLIRFRHGLDRKTRARVCALRSTISCSVIDEPPLDAPDEDWLVWADAMQQIGDPRGELLALRHDPAYVRAHAPALFGRTLGYHLRDDHVRITKWRRYLPEEIELRIGDGSWGPQLVVETAGAERMRAVRGLTIAGVPRNEPLSLAQTLGWFRESSLARRLTSLALVDDTARSMKILRSPGAEPGPNRVHFGALGELWLACPQLEHLRLVVADPAQVQFQVIRLPALRSFTLHPLAWVEGLADMLGNSRWPQLVSFEARVVESFFGEQPPAEAPDLRPLFASFRGLALERLALTSFSTWNCLEVLGAELPSLRELDLSDSTFDTQRAHAFAAHPLVRQLQRLVLRDVSLESAAMFEGLEVMHSHRAGAPAYRHVIG
jgi:hypothetical protein